MRWSRGFGETSRLDSAPLQRRADLAWLRQRGLCLRARRVPAWKWTRAPRIEGLRQRAEARCAQEAEAGASAPARLDPWASAVVGGEAAPGEEVSDVAAAAWRPRGSTIERMRCRSQRAHPRALRG